MTEVLLLFNWFAKHWFDHYFILYFAIYQMG